MRVCILRCIKYQVIVCNIMCCALQTHYIRIFMLIYPDIPVFLNYYLAVEEVNITISYYIYSMY